MMPLTLLVASLMSQGSTGAVTTPATNLLESSKAPETGRFEKAAPLGTLPAITIDRELNFRGPAKDVADRNNLQGRMLWIDCTANIERYNTEEKIIKLVEKIKAVGFNTIVLDVKPISGQVIYPTALAPKLTEWRGKSLPADFDPVAIFVREAARVRLTIFASMNAFCDGHRLMNAGPGFNRKDEQSVVYDPTPLVKIGTQTFPVELKQPEDKFETQMVVAVPTLKDLPDKPNNGFLLVIRANGDVVEGYEDILPTRANLVVPRGGMILYGEGQAATFLRSNATPGGRVELDSASKFVRIGDSTDKQYPLMTSPTNPSVRRRLIDLAREFVVRYRVAGIIYDDRLRYTGINGDFTEIARTQFEQVVGKRLQWPDDIYKATYSWNGTRGLRPGPYYDRWMTWRAQVIKDFIGQVRSSMRQVRPDAQLGVYAGSWYGEYSTYGNNWASNDLEAGFWFLDKNYAQTGLAGDIDLLVTGCYYKVPTVFEALVRGKGIGATVESAGYLSYRAVRDKTWVYAGISLSDFKDNPEDLAASLQAAVQTTNGVMVFDLSHDIEPMWPVFERAFRINRIAPTTQPGFLTEIRRRRQWSDSGGKKDPPIIINNGSPGVGF